MRQLLEALRDRPHIDTGPLRETPEWELAVAWGWMLASGDLTETGWGHSDELPTKLLRD